MADLYSNDAKSAKEKDKELSDDGGEKSPCPVIIRDAEKVLHERDYFGTGGFPLNISRGYASLSQSKIGSWQIPGIFGNSWSTTLDTQIRLDYSKTEACWFVMGRGAVGDCDASRLPIAISVIKNLKQSGFLRIISGPYSNDYYPSRDPNDSERIYKSGSTWIYENAGQSSYVFSSVGRLGKIIPYKSGKEWSLQYENNSLVEVLHSSGRKLVFNWKSSSVSGLPPVLDAITLPNGKQVKYVIEPIGSSTKLSNRFLKEVVYPEGTGSLKYDWEPNGNIVAKYVDGVKRGDYQYEYGRVKYSGLVGGINRSTFSTAANKRIVTNAKGGVKEYAYDDHKRLIGVDKNSTGVCPGAAKEIQYYSEDDPRSKVKFKEDWNGKRTAYTYWKNGGDVKSEYVNGVTKEYWWGVNGQLSTLKVWNGARNPSLCAVGDSCLEPTQLVPARVIRYVYGGKDDAAYFGRLMYKTTKALKYGSGDYTPERKHVFAYEFYDSGVVKKTTVDGPEDGDSDKTISEYNSYGDLEKVTNGAGHVVKYNYRTSDAGLPYQMVDPNGIPTDFTYDARGRLKQTSVIGYSSLVTKIEYYGDNQIKQITAPAGYYVKYNLDEARRTKTIESLFAGNNYAIRQEAFEYDLLNNITSSKSNLVTASGVVTNNVVTLDADYDEFGNRTVDHGQNEQLKSYTYTPGGNVETVTNAMGHVVSFSYNAYGQLEWSKNQENEITRYYYDRLGYLKEVKDALGNSTLYNRNGFGEVEQLVSADTGVTEYEYTTGGLLRKIETASNTTITYDYDNLGRRGNVKAEGSDIQNIDYSYDSYCDVVARQSCQFGKARLCAVTDNSGYTSYSYTADGNLARQTSKVDGATYSINYGYDSYRRLYLESLPGGVNARYGYDTAGNANKVMVQINGGSWLPLVEVTQGLREEVWEYGQGATPWGGGNITATKKFDLDGRLVAYNNYFYNKSFSYDNRDAISKVVGGPEGQYNYVYDDVGRLKREKYNNTTYLPGSYSYVYDSNGNRDSYQLGSQPPKDFVIDPDSNHITKIGSEPLVYDEVGNLKEHRRSTTSAAPKYRYYYDSLERMTGFYKYDTGQSNYIYNYANQRVSKYARKNQGGPAVINHYRYLYDSRGLLRAETKADSTAIDKTYIYFRSVLVGFVMNGKLYSVLHDQTGRPQLVYVASGSTYDVVFAVKSQGFKRQVVTNKIGGMNIGFPGQYYDSESGLWYNINRYYDPEMGRYTQSDPIGLTGGMNTYAYVGGNPISLIDPYGLKTCLLTVRNSAGLGVHSAVQMTNLGTIYDPNGGYSQQNGGGEYVDAKNTDGFNAYHQSDGDTVESQCKDTSKAQELAIQSAIISAPTSGALGCSMSASSVLNASGVFSGVQPDTFWPGNLSDQFGAAKVNGG